MSNPSRTYFLVPLITASATSLLAYFINQLPAIQDQSNDPNEKLIKNIVIICAVIFLTVLSAWITSLQSRQGMSRQAKQNLRLNQSKPREKSSSFIEPYELKSDTGVDYTWLRDLLASRKWKEADEETARIMFKIYKEQESTWVANEPLNIENFPCTDLQIINQLWVFYSNGHFGFSIQKEIWLNVGGNETNADYVIFCRFGREIGWLKGSELYKKWIGPFDVNYSMWASRGHLPWGGLYGLWKQGVYQGLFEDEKNENRFSLRENYSHLGGYGSKPFWWHGIPSLVSKLKSCNI